MEAQIGLPIFDGMGAISALSSLKNAGAVILRISNFGAFTVRKYAAQLKLGAS